MADERPVPCDVRCRVALISTGGTIEKSYDELTGSLANHVSVLDVMLGALRLEGVGIDRIPLMNKDSLDMTQEDHELIASRACAASRSHDAVVVVHGTDRLSLSGECIVAQCPESPVPIVLTGAMRPWAMRTTDALQNLTEALMVVQWLAPGVYVSMHNRVLQFPGVVKDRSRGRFVRADELDAAPAP